MDHVQARKFLEEAAKYFEKRKTGGEDLAHWSNAFNARNCRKIAKLLDVQTDALRDSLVSMHLASAIPKVSDEYDFSESISKVEDALVKGA